MIRRLRAWGRAVGGVPAGDQAAPRPAGSRALPTVHAVQVVVTAGLAMTLALVALVVSFVVYERHERLGTALGRMELLARVLEDHAARSLDTAALALAALGEVVLASPVRGDEGLRWVLSQSLAGLPVLRAVAVVDSQGLVLASSDGVLQGRVLDLARIGPLPQPGQPARMGPYVPGRGLQTLATGEPVQAVPRGLGFVPMVRVVTDRAGQTLLLVGAINPDAIANHQQQVLRDQSATAVLTGLDRRVLAATEDAAAVPGDTLDAALPPWARYLPSSEHGRYRGAGTRSDTQLVAFRAARGHPVVVMVEVAEADALAEWRREALMALAAAGAAATVLLLMTALAARSLRARERARRQRDAAQQQVASRERELSVIVKSVQEVLFRTDAEGRLVFVNARWQAASQLAEDESLGRYLAELVRPESAHAAQMLFAHDGPEGLRTAPLRLGGEGAVREFDVAVAPLRADGGIVGFAGSAVDVTVQRQAQAQLRAQLAFTELLLDMLPLPMSIQDLQGRYITVNRAWLDFRGRRRRDVVGRPREQFTEASERDLHARHDRELLAHGGRVRYEATAVHQDGSLRDIAVTKAQVPGDDGKPAGVLAVWMDVTEFRQAERATREARDAAEEASRAKTEFIANISHELRTPLQSIIGFSELGQMRTREQARISGMFGDIHAAGQRMLALVNDLLDVARIESTVGTFHLERTDVRGLVRDVAAELAPQLGARQLRLDLDLGDAPLVAKVDPLRFQQAVRNVLANAIRFSPPGTRVGVTGEVGEDAHVHLAVRDQGPGIPPAELESIFEAFVQSSKTKDGSGGTGLGLAIVRKILAAHGGDIRAENNADGVGATFHLRLPARGFADTQTLA